MILSDAHRGKRPNLMEPVADILRVMVSCLVIFAIGCQGNSEVSELDRSPLRLSWSVKGELHITYLGRVFLWLPSGKRISPVHSRILLHSASSPDGRRIAYTQKGRGNLHQLRLVGADGKGDRPLIESDFDDGIPTFSPDGRMVAFVRAHNKRPYSMGGIVLSEFDIYVADIVNRKERRVTHQKFYSLGPPSFSPDGGAVCFSADTLEEQSGTNVYTVDLKTAKVRQLTKVGLFNTNPSYSPDGKSIVFCSDRGKDFDYELWVMNSDGTNAQQLTKMDGQTYCHSSIFSKDGKDVFYLRMETDTYELWKVGLKDRKPMRLVSDLVDLINE